MAVDARTGKYKWHYQTVPEDAWDYDAAMPFVVADLEYEEGSRRVVMQAPKNGFYYVLDAQTGELLAADAIVEVTWASHVDLETGRPVELPGARYYANEKPEELVLVKPQASGAHNWYPMSFSPKTQWVYIPAQDLHSYFADRGPYGFHLQGPEEPLPMGSGKLLAWDPVEAVARWTVDYPLPYNSGVLSTAGGLVFQGTAGGEFIAYRDTTGERLWSRKTGTSILAAPVSYQVDGEQFILVGAGVGGGNGMITPSHSSTPDSQGPSRLFAFKLGGEASFPDPVVAPPVPRPPPRIGTVKDWARGKEIWNTCGHCHGAEVVGVGPSRDAGGIPDLRYATAESHAQWDAIVLEGLRKEQGMPGFGDYLSPEDSHALQAYVIAQAWALYETTQRDLGGKPGK